MVRDLDIADGRIALTITLTVPVSAPRRVPAAGRPRAAPCPASSASSSRSTSCRRTEGRAHREAARQRRRAVPGISVDAKTRVLAVASGKGGVGKSSLTVNLAAAFSSWACARACSTPTSRPVDPGMLGVHQRLIAVDKMIVPPVRGDESHVDRVLSTTTRPSWRGPMLHRALEWVPLGRPLGRARLARRGHAARHRGVSISRATPPALERRSSS